MSPTGRRADRAAGVRQRPQALVEVLAAADQALEADGGLSNWWPNDLSLVRTGFPDWTIAAASHGHGSGTHAGHMLVLRDRAGDRWLMMETHQSAIRLLLGREWCYAKDYRFSADDGVKFLLGSLDDLFDYAVKEHRRGRWGTNRFLWFVDALPGERAEAERVMLAFWFAEARRG